MELTEIQKVKIEAFCADTEMYNAVRHILLANLYSHGVIEGKGHDPLINGAYNLVALAMENPIPDAEIGAHLRGMWAGINILKNGFDALDKVKTEKPEKLLKTHKNIAE